MLADRVFLVYSELSHQSAPLLSEQCSGAFVTCFVKAKYIEEAIEIAKNVLTEDDYVVTDIDKVILFDPEDWEHDKESAHLAQEVMSDGEARYSEFSIW